MKDEAQVEFHDTRFIYGDLVKLIQTAIYGEGKSKLVLERCIIEIRCAKPIPLHLPNFLNLFVKFKLRLKNLNLKINREMRSV